MEAMNTLTQEQLDSYRAHGYIFLQGVIPEHVIETTKSVFARWVDRLAAQWKEEGLITDLKEDLDFWHRLEVLWNDAGRPRYQRSPRREIVEPDMHAVLGDEALVDIAEDLLGTPEVTAHGVFNARPKLPNQIWTNTPWHQDVQYKGISPHVHVPTFWFPLQKVYPEYSSLGVHPDYHDGKLFEPYEDETGFLGIRPEDRKHLTSHPIEMDAGDLLCFTSLTPHHAYTNETDRVRWSLDIRYQATDSVDPTEEQENIGFVVRSGTDQSRVENFDQWYAKGWADRAW
jgi:hypothetical protein